MNCSIPSDIVTLVYKELHRHLTRQLINEYRSTYDFNKYYCGCSFKENGFMFNYRDLYYSNNRYYQDHSIYYYKDKREKLYFLPKRYKYSTVKETDYV